jgi:hypothetical protein
MDTGFFYAVDFRKEIIENEGSRGMARKTIFVSDLTGTELDDKDAVRITVSFSDARRGVYVVDASAGDSVVETLVEKGTKQARRGRKPKMLEGA